MINYPLLNYRALKMEWWASLFASKSAQAGLAGAFGGLCTYIVTSMDKGVRWLYAVKYTFVGALTSGYVGLATATILHVPDQYRFVGFGVGVASFSLIAAINKINWVKLIQAFKPGGDK